MPTFPNRIPREQASSLGRETVRILDGGRYETTTGKTVVIADLGADAVRGTVSYPPDSAVPAPLPGRHQTRTEVINDTTLSGVRRFVARGHSPVALNFASATNPGGGFLSGARAQEEYLAWSTGLYACLRGNPMYDFHRARHDPMYSNYAIYSPAVPVIRSDEGDLLEDPYTVAIITSPAPNAARMIPTRNPEIIAAMRERIEKVLSVGLHHGHDSIVLGAWGCGAFGNDPRAIADLFADALHGQFSGCYQAVVFTILDWSPEKRFIGPFETAFGSAST